MTLLNHLPLPESLFSNATFQILEKFVNHPVSRVKYLKGKKKSERWFCQKRSGDGGRMEEEGDEKNLRKS